MLNAGDPAPPFKLHDQHGEWVELGALRGRPVVVFFYPRDGTSGCTRQACELRDTQPRLELHGATVLGISGDDRQSHTRFADDLGLGYSLLVDADHAVCRAYGTWVPMPPAFRHGTEEDGEYRGILRSLFVIGTGGRLTLAKYDVADEGMADAIVAAVSAG